MKTESVVPQRSKKRRLCLSALAATALGATVAAHGAMVDATARAPRRLVVLNWDLTEMVLSLGVAPIGVPAPAWYTSSVVAPPLPGGVVDVGLLFQPNYDLLYELRPDLMVITPAHASVKASFERIAPTLTLGSYMTDPQPYRAMRVELSTLARRLGLDARAQSLMDETERVLTHSRAALDAALPKGGYAPVYVAQVIDDRHLRIFGGASMFGEVLRTLGIRNVAAALADGSRGALVAGGAASSIVELERLIVAPDAQMLWVGASGDGTAAGLQRNPVWRQLPFAQPGRSAILPVVSPTGALISVQRFTRAVADAMQTRTSHVV
ncbi:ABC transporter substrate-binding protein [Paraburkholderia sp. BL21I4N1]|uniref:ABC transporter substrate-binding protein n=1 Tax=Paraburkholderia sp. BL21I4N1 TaxID=1938801 RepID=UPI000CFBD80E|nr:ABC transporter substrate-binding protein [Paraburkholderia sp. BL21I4N1]PQV44823.1 iron complex transport system substrate-binding protein [Paraburkholderia sp. BL21I4N1]